MRTEALDRAIRVAGGVAELARRLGVTSQAVSQWERVPPERVIQVEGAVERAVTRQELRPDLYPAEAAE